MADGKLLDFPEDLPAITTFRFPIRHASDNDTTLDAKYRRVSARLNTMRGVHDVYHEEDEPYGLFVEVEIQMKSKIFHTPLSSVYKGVRAVLSDLYNIDECY